LEGKCWPGLSRWLDFFQSKVRTYWKEQYLPYKAYSFNENTYAWIDMNEPAVLDKPEVTTPRGTL